MSEEDQDPPECDDCSPCTPPEGALFRELTIVNRTGLPARAPANYWSCVDSFDAEVLVGRCGAMGGGTSIMGILTLGAGIGMTILVTATGKQAQQALDAIAALVGDRFGEDE